MDTKIKIRIAEPGDFKRVNAVLNDWWGGRSMSDKLPRLFFDHFHQTSFIAEANGALAGFLIGFLSPSQPDEAYIHFIGVHPDFRKEGLAKNLYHRFFNLAQADGRSVVKAITSPINKKSIAYHTRIGFECVPGDKKIEDTPVWTDYDGPGEDRVVFKIKIG